MFHSIHLLTTAVMLRMMVSSEHEWAEDKKEKEHSHHKFPQIMNKITREALPEINYIVDVLKNSNQIKKKAFYVEMKDTLIVPDKEIEEKQCKEILNIINSNVPGFDFVLESEDKEFKDFVLWIDPQIMSGTMKSE